MPDCTPCDFIHAAGRVNSPTRLSACVCCAALPTVSLGAEDYGRLGGE